MIENNNAIPPVSYLPRMSDQTYTVERVSRAPDGQHKIQQTTYTVTTYDHNGKISTSTNSSQINFLV
jgi:hypothetical protein